MNYPVLSVLNVLVCLYRDSRISSLPEKFEYLWTITVMLSHFFSFGIIFLNTMPDDNNEWCERKQNVELGLVKSQMFLFLACCCTLRQDIIRCEVIGAFWNRMMFSNWITRANGWNEKKKKLFHNVSSGGLLFTIIEIHGGH